MPPSLLVHTVQLGSDVWLSIRYFFGGCPYCVCVCVCVDLSVCVICVSDVLGVVYKELDNLWCMFVLDSHLSTYVKLSLATWNSLFYVIC